MKKEDRTPEMDELEVKALQIMQGATNRYLTAQVEGTIGQQKWEELGKMLWNMEELYMEKLRHD